MSTATNSTLFPLVRHAGNASDAGDGPLTRIFDILALEILMHSTAELRRTPLFSAQKALGARLVDFHGWELPIQFSSILKEHLAVRSHCGLFDVSHMGQIFVSGPQALDFLQKVNSNDIKRAGPGKAIYSHLLNEQGGVVDDVIVGCLAPNRYLVVVNAATSDKDFAWFQKQAEDLEVRLENRSDEFAMVALQ